jgi:hypothetical protein
MMRARGTFSVGGLHYATRSRVRAYEECPESGSAVCRDVRPDGQKRPRQEESDDANWANKGSSKSSGASWAALPRVKGSRQPTCVRFISGLRVISRNAQSDRLTSAFPQKRTSASGQGMSALCQSRPNAPQQTQLSSTGVLVQIQILSPVNRIARRDRRSRAIRRRRGSSQRHGH